MNAEDCGVWTLDQNDRRILRFSSEGLLEREIRVGEAERRLDKAERLALDPYDGSLWITDERRAVHISSDGNLLGSFVAGGRIRGIAVALDQSLWILGTRELWQVDASGNPRSSFAIGSRLAADARFFAVDSLGGFLWIADAHQLAQLKLTSLGDPLLSIRLARPITGLALDSHAGKVWIGQQDALLAIDRQGAVVHRIELDGRRFRKPEVLAFDPASRSLWVGDERSVSRFTETGEFVITLSARDGDEAIGVPAIKVQPTLSLLRPPENALTNNPQPEMRLSYGADCNAVSCGFSASYFGAYTLSATLNDQSVGEAFRSDGGSGEASYVPPARLPEGTNRFAAQAKDSFGHASHAISNTFTVDTIAPRFLALTPPDGAASQTANVVIQGTIDDPQATVVLNGSGLSQTGGGFAFPVTLHPGDNVFTLSAIDRAGNVSNMPLRLVLSSISMTIVSPANGATISGDSVTVSGSFQGPPNTGITVNGIPAGISGNNFTALNVPLENGPNTLVVLASTLDLQSVTRTLAVTSTGPAPVQVVATPSQEMAPLDVAFTVNNRTGKNLLSIRADFEGTGSFAFLSPGQAISHRYTRAGIYQAQFVVIDSTPTAYSQIVTIVVQDPTQLDQQLKQVWQGFASALSAGDVARAKQYFNAQAQLRYGPVLDALQAKLPQIVSTFTDLSLLDVSNDLGEYAVGRTVSGVKQIFLIYFLRDADGVWRLDSM